MANEIVKENNVKNVIMQAARLFAENGVENTTFIMIGKASGVTGRSVQNYFQSKDDLIVEVLSACMRLSIDKFNKRVNTEQFKELSGLDQFTEIIRSVLIEAKQRCHYIISITEMEEALLRSNKEVPSRLYSVMYAEIARQIMFAIKKGIEDGTIKKEVGNIPKLAKGISFTLKGLKRQLAFIYMSDEMRTRENPDKIIAEFMAISRYTVQTGKNAGSII